MTQYSYTELTTQDKLNILNARIKNNESLIYGTQVNILEFQSHDPVDQAAIDAANKDIENATVNIQVLRQLIEELS
jgi:hypothetical protein